MNEQIDECLQYPVLEIKTLGLGSGNQDMGLWELRVPKCALDTVFLASNSLHNQGVQNNHSHVTMQIILNKCIEIKFSVECIV